jgi:glucose-6-phosphate 1-dehydrogenase
MSDARPGPTTMVIFGATGDLTRRKLLPALYRLESLKMLLKATGHLRARPWRSSHPTGPPTR